MTPYDLALPWPPPGTGTLLALTGVALAGALAFLARALPVLEGQKTTAAARVLALALVASGAVVFAGNQLAPPLFALLMLAATLLGVAQLDWLRAVSATVLLAASSRIRRGDRIRVGDLEGVVDAFQVGWIVLRSDEGTRAIPASALLHRAAAASGDRAEHTESPCALAFTVEGAEPGVEATLRQVVLCSPYAALGRAPEVVATFRGAHCTLRVRAWALTAAHTDRLASDVTSRCLALGLRELT